MRRVLKALLILILLGATVFAGLVMAVCARTSATWNAGPSDCIIVLGARVRPDGTLSDTLRYRAESALRAYQGGLAENLIVSGGRGADEPASEAEAMRDWLVEKGVPAKNIFLEDRSTDTWENLEFSQEVMQENGWTSAIVVTSDYHLQRAVWISRDLGIETTALAAQSPKPFGVYWSNRLREACSWIVYAFDRAGILLFR